MPVSIQFSRSCPTCGRMLSIPVNLIGKKVVCQHCNCDFLATHEETSSPDKPIKSPLLARADELLRRADALIG